MIFTEKRIRELITKELARTQIRRLEEEAIQSILKKLEPHINGAIQSNYTLEKIAKKVAFDLDKNVKTLVSNRINTESFVDEIVARIKTKQL